MIKTTHKRSYVYSKAKGVKQDYAKALVWFGKAASQGNADAQYNLGNMYRRGEGVQQNFIEAAKWYEKAAEQNMLKHKIT